MKRLFSLTIYFLGWLMILNQFGKVTPTYAKSYSIPQDQFEIQINADKSVDVNERLTYDFDGSLAEFYWQAIGPEWKVEQQKVEVTVKLPQSVEDINDLSIYGNPHDFPV